MKKKMFLVLDVETANTTDCALVYDIGGAVCDRRGNISETFSFVIKDVFDYEEELMRTAYYAMKVPIYLEGIKTGRFKKVSFYDAKAYISAIIKKYGISEVYAYNANFDRNALNNTQRWLTKSKYRYFLPYGVEIKCIWHMACQVICTQKGYRKFCTDNGKISGKANLQTSAETVFAYMNQAPGFTEQHIGVEDVEIEVDILAHCFRQHKKMDRNINRQCWRIPQG